MKITLPDFRKANILVVGDVMLDRYWCGSTRRLSPEAQVPLVKVHSIKEYPGGAANVAVNIVSLGANVRLVGLTGIDDAAQVLSNKLNSVNICCDFVSVPTHATITKLRVMSCNQPLIRLDFENNFYNVDAKLIFTRIQQALPYIAVLVLSDYAKGTLSQVQNIIKLARAAKVTVLIDPKCSNFECYRGATVLTPNLLEFEAVVGPCNSEADLVKRGTKLMSDFALSALLITRSKSGMTLLQPGLMPLHLPAQAQEVFDVTGAGDTVIGVLAAALGAGNSLEESCLLANAAAGIVVGKPGTSSISLMELKSAVHAIPTVDLGVMTETQIKIAVFQARLRGEKLVMTNGVFDILHAGHVSYLSSARKMGDRLIVAVNSDVSSKKLKGAKRPFNTLQHRMIVLASLKSVDWVVPFEEDTPRRLISNILPDLLVKGGDYKPEDIAGSVEVWANGGDVKVLNFENDLSTTNIIAVSTG